MSALMAGRAAQRIASAASAKLAPRAVSMSTAAPVSRSGINFRTAAAATYQVPPMMLNAEGLQQPHGGKLVSLLAAAEDRAAIIKSATKTMELSDRNACDVELLAVGAFSPLEGFMNQENYDSVTIGMRLKSGLLFGIPIVLDTDREDVVVGDKVLLQYQGLDLAVVTIDSKWTPNKPLEALNVYGTSSLEHPAVQMVSMERGKYYMGGAVQGLTLPTRVFPCATPAEVRATLPPNQDILAFQCRNPIHKAHYELFIRALDAPNVRNPGAVCLVHPTCGPTQDDDIPGDVRFRTYEVLKNEVANPRLRWAYLPYSMHMAGPREAIQHMLIRKNYGATHFIIGRDMAGCKSSLTGNDFYGAYDAQNLANTFAEELGMQTVASLNIAFTAERGYVTADVAKEEGLTTVSLSGTKFRQMLRSGADIPRTSKEV
ncbi:MAG: hypothetical protein WDW36_005256 [Sanguina aurantia]